MHARVTRYKMKDGELGNATELMHQLKDAIMGMPGMLHFINVAQPNGAGYVIALVESAEVSEANKDKVMAMWGRFADHLEAIPEPEGFDVLANWEG